MAIFCLVFVSIFTGCNVNGNYTIIEVKCGNCHKSKIVYGKKRDIEEWKRILYAMKIRGLVITEKEQETFFNVLKEKNLITY